MNKLKCVSKLLRFFLAAVIGLIAGVVFSFAQPHLFIIVAGVMIACICDYDLEFALGCFVAAGVVYCLGG